MGTDLDQAKTLRTIIRASIYAISTTVNLPLDSANPENYLKMVCPHGTGGGSKPPPDQILECFSGLPALGDIPACDISDPRTQTIVADPGVIDPDPLMYARVNARQLSPRFGASYGIILI